VSNLAERAKLDAPIDYPREADVLVAMKFGLARSLYVASPSDRGRDQREASLRILAMCLGAGAATGTIMLQVQVLGAVAKHERSMMLERQRWRS